MPEVVYLDGRFLAPDQAMVSVNDRGFLFGDAVYEVIRSYRGRLFALDRHLDRLARSLRETEITGVDIPQVRAVIEEAYARSGFPEAVVYLQITRGVAPRRHAYPEGLRPTILVHVRDAGPLFDLTIREGVRCITARDLRWRRCDIKSTNLLPNVLAQTRAKRQGAYEAILVDDEGYVTEATSASVFCVEAGVVVTRPLGPEILASVTREVVIELAKGQQIPVSEEPISLRRLRAADEVFLAGTGDEVCPVLELDGEQIGDGRPGPITRQLQASYLALVAGGEEEQ